MPKFLLDEKNASDKKKKYRQQTEKEIGEGWCSREIENEIEMRGI